LGKNKTKIKYDKHPSPSLCKAYKGYQGQKPEDAKFIFLGLDANFAIDIEKSPIFEEVIEYLTDGVKYWKKRNRHHPFLSPAYKKGSGYKYHYEFSKLGLTPEYADKVSFTELLDCPTCGNTSEKRFRELLNEDHLRKLDELILSKGKDRAVYIKRGVYRKLYEIGQKNDCFKWLPKPQDFQLNKLYTIPNDSALKIYVITHFSDAISKEHLLAIKRTIQM
jgi:hypothetical protein